ncbi:hypothetical protein [Neptunomonas japonica]|uniref:hypothetical protein n=1 Tax=Neptunomonas japonica TaxID=417574 RepID=UPI001916879A|nr:hypothetical protein [Neptunomonas japonica]
MNVKGFHSYNKQSSDEQKSKTRQEKAGSSVRDQSLDDKNMTGDKTKKSAYNFVGIAG